MNEEQITFRINERKFTTKLVPDVKPQNKVYYYTMSESEDIIDLTLIENDITKAIEDDNEEHSIMIELEKDGISLNSKIEIISDNLKGKFLDEAIAFYKNKCKQYIK